MNKRELRAATDAAAKVQLAIGASSATPSEKAAIAHSISEYHRHLTDYHQELWLQFRREAMQHSVTKGEKTNHHTHTEG